MEEKRQVGTENKFSLTRYIYATLPLFAFSCSVFASVLPSGISYHGRLLAPDGVTPVTGIVTFDIQIKSPDSSNCILYEETQTQNLTGSQGVFALTLNDGSGTRTDAAPQMSIDDVFSNRIVINHSCGGGPYTPNPGDGRILKVTFQSTTMAMAEPMPDQALNFAPLAIESKQISGYAAENILRFENADHSLFNTSPLNNAQYDELLRLVNGTSTQYAGAPNAATGTSIYASPTAITSAVVGDMWLDTSAGGNVDVLKINTRSGVQEIPLTAGSFLTSVAPGVGISVSTAGSVATVSIANSGVGTTQLAGSSVTAAKLDPAINIGTTGYVSAHSIAVSNTQTTPNTIGIYAPAAAFTNYTLVLPTSPGNSGQVLKTDGTGNLSWVDAAAGALNSAHIFVGNASNAATDVAMSGDAKIDNTGAVTVTGLQGVGVSTTAPLTGQVLVYNGGVSKWQAQNFSIGSLIGQGGTSQFANASCSSSQTLTWSSLTDTFTCSSISGLDAGAIATGTIDPARLPASSADWANSGANIYNTNTGNVGVGTSAPAHNLTILGSGADTEISVTNATASGLAVVRVYNDGGAGGFIDASGSTSGNLPMRNNFEIGATGSAYLVSNATVSNGGSGTLNFLTGGYDTTTQTRMVIDASGNVGIGTTAPATKLDVAGVVRSSTGGFTFPDGTTQITAAVGAGTTSPWTIYGANIANNNTGNVGIGTTAPGSLIEGSGVNPSLTLRSTITNDNLGMLLAEGTDSKGAFFWKNTSGQQTVSIINYKNGPLSLSTSAAERLRIDNVGNVGIGTTAPTALLHVLGTTTTTVRIDNTNSTMDGSADARLQLSNPIQNWQIRTDSALSNAFVLRDSTASDYKMVVKTNGSVGIGTTAPATKLDVAGVVRSSTGGFTFPDGTTQITAAVGAGTTNPWTTYGTNIANNNTGNVGIGTTAPAYQLHINSASGDASVGVSALAGSKSYLRFLEGTTAKWSIGKETDNTFYIYNSAAGGNSLNITAGGNTGLGGVTAATSRLVVKGTTTDSSAGSLNVINSSSSSLLYVRNDGNVGIGTTAPGDVLDVWTATGNAGVRVSSSLSNYATLSPNVGNGMPGFVSGTGFFDLSKVTIGGMGGTQSPVLNVKASSTGALMQSWLNSSGTTVDVIDAAGNIGVGTTSPASLLTLANWSGPASSIGQIVLQNHSSNGGAAGIGFKQGNANGGLGQGTKTGIFATGPGNFGQSDLSFVLNSGANSSDLSIAADTKMIILNGGNVGIGTTTPAYKLDVAGAINGTQLLVNGVDVSGGAGAWTVAGGNVYRASGYVGLGTTAPTNLLDANGTDSTVYTPTGAALSPGSGSTILKMANTSPTNGTASFLSLSAIDGGGGRNQNMYLGAVSQGGTSLDYAPNIVIGSRTGVSAYSERMRIDSIGNVGIGTTAPGSGLDVQNGVIRVGKSGSAGYLQFARPVDGSYQGTVGWTNGNSNDFVISSSGGGSNILLMTSAANERMRIDSTGKVGIGTTAPLANLHIDGANTVGAWINSAIFDGGNAGADNSGSYIAIQPAVASGRHDGGRIYGGRWTSGTSIARGIRIAATDWGGTQGVSAEYNFLQLDPDNNAFYVSTNNAERLRIDSTGNVGIGTTAPAYKLDVAGAINGTQLLVNGVDVSGGAGAWTVAGGNVYRASGNVGIGTSAPANLLEIDGTSSGMADGINLNNTSALATNKGSALRFQNQGISEGVIATQLAGGTSSDAFMTFQTRGSGVTSERLRIDNNGNVGIGTTGPAARLDVAGSSDISQLTVRANSTQTTSLATFTSSTGSVYSGVSPTGRFFIPDGAAAAPGLYFGSNVSGLGIFRPTTDNLALSTAGNERMRIDSAGKVGIGTTTPVATLDVVGTFAFSNAGALRAGLTSLASDGIMLYPTTYGSGSSLDLNTAHGSVIGGKSRMRFGSNAGGAASTNFNELSRIEFDTNLNRLNFMTSTYSTTPPYNYTTPTEKMTLLGNGNVGIGTTAPNYLLDVNGSINAAGIYVNGVAVGTGGSSPWAVHGLNTSYDAAGKVGIGTSTPYTNLVVTNSNYGPTSTYQIAVENNSTDGGYAGIGFKNTDVTGANGVKTLIVKTGSGYAIGDLRFVQNSTFDYNDANPATDTKMILTSAGNVGIGTTAPSTLLDIAGSVRLSSTQISAAANGGAVISMIGGSSVSAPTYSWVSDTGTGFYHAASSSIGISTNGFDRMRFDGPTGNVGIGTTAPTSTFDVAGTAHISNGLAVNNYILSGYAQPATYSATSGSGVYPNSAGAITTYNSSSTDNDYAQFLIKPQNSSGNTQYAYIGGFSNTGAGVYTPTIVIGQQTGAAAYAERMRIDTSGNVGIGTTAPAYKLDVAGNINATGLYVNGVSVGGGSVDWTNPGTIGSATANTGVFTRLALTAAGAASTPPLKVTGAWYTGGTATTTTPQFLIEPTGTSSTTWSTGGTGLGVDAVTGFAGSLIDLKVAGASKFSVSAYGAVAAASIYSFNGTSINIGAASSTSVTLNPSGATATSGTVDHIVTSQSFAPTSGTGIYNAFKVAPTINQTGGANGTSRGIYVSPTLTAAADYRAIETSNATGYSLYTGAANSYFGGNVGIGTTAPTQTLEVNGNVLAAAYLYSSDKRLKKNIDPIANALDKIESLNGVFYDWKMPLNASADRRQMGVIAQDVEKVFPEAVDVGRDGIKRVNYPMLVAPLIEAVKDLKSKNQDLQNRNQDLQTRFDQLTAKLCAKDPDFCDMSATPSRQPAGQSR